MLRWEIKKLTRNMWNLPIVAGVTCIWIIILYFAKQNGQNQFLLTYNTFWYVLGSVAVGFIILFVNTRIFSLDKEEKVKEIILTTRNGKANIVLVRIMATLIYINLIIFVFFLIQIIGFLLFNSNETNSTLTYIMDSLESVPYVWIGSVLFSIFTICICIIYKSHTMTVILCGFLFGMTYTLRSNILQQYSFEWFLEKGFFSYLIRAKNILFEPHITILIIWYGIIMIGIIILTIKIQLRRHEI